MSLRIALAGNPNSGKTTLFNALTGSTQYVGNWPGVTVEKKEGKYKKQKDVIITDLPGIYSLSPYTLEEVVARNYLLKEKPDAILNIVDATNLERNLYLTTQCRKTAIISVSKNCLRSSALRSLRSLHLKEQALIRQLKRQLVLQRRKSHPLPLSSAEKLSRFLTVCVRSSAVFLQINSAGTRSRFLREMRRSAIRSPMIKRQQRRSSKQLKRRWMMIPRASSPMRDMSLSQVFLKAVMRRRMREI